jgi:hypothetical protein
MSGIRASRRKYHIIYKTTCVVTDKWYIGMHSTDDLEDGYMGSGQQLRRSVKKHGRDQHRTEVLEFMPDRKALGEREAVLVTKKLMEDALCMNLTSGGTGAADRPLVTKESTSAKLSATGLKRWEREKTTRAESNAVKPFSMTRDEIIAELVLPNGHLNKNATRNLKPRIIVSRTREAERARKWNFIRQALQHKNFPEASDLELINRYVFDIELPPTCKACEKQVSFFRFGQPYASHCSSSCAMRGNTNRVL